MEVGKLGLHQAVGGILRVEPVSAFTDRLDMEDDRYLLAEGIQMKKLADTRVDLIF